MTIRPIPLLLALLGALATQRPAEAQGVVGRSIFFDLPADAPVVPLERWRPALPAAPGAGECWKPQRSDAGTTLVMLFETDTLSRQVSLWVGHSGELWSYADERWGTDPRVLETAIEIDFERGRAVATNPGGTWETAHAAPAEMLEAEHLGSPGRMIERIRARCGDGAREATNDETTGAAGRP